MKVLVICTAETWGGLEQTALRDVVELNKQGIRAELLCFDKGVILDHAKELGLRFYTIKNKNKYFNLEIFIKLRSLIKKENFNVIHFHTFNTIMPSLLAVRGLDVFVAATRHIYVEHVKKDFLHRSLLRRLDMLFAISDFARMNLLETYPLSKDRVKTLYIGIDVKSFERSSGKRERFLSSYPLLRNASKIIGMVGRIDPMKGQLEFLEAAKRIIREDPKTMFLIVGAPTLATETNYLDMLKKRVNELGISSNLVFAGFCKDVSEPLSVMDVFVMPSYFEAFGLAALQAMANRVPVISTNKGSVEEIIPSRDYGFIIPPRDALAIADSVLTLIGDKKMAEGMAERAYKRVCNVFDQKLYFEKLISVYKRKAHV